MKDIVNKTTKPLRIPLPGGKILHLGLEGRGQVPDEALDRPALKRLIEAGRIEVLEQDSRTLANDNASPRMRRSVFAHPASRDTSRKGDR